MSENTDHLFVPEQLYHRRRDIHDRFGGHRRAHYSHDAVNYNAQLAEVVHKLEKHT